MQLIRLIIVWLLVGGLGLAADAELRFARIFTDHAVLQRDRPVPIWGWASPAAEVTVSFAGQQQAAIADASGRWQVQLAPLAASAEPRTLSVSGSGETVALEDILVGDVWLAGGQSNMGFSISKSTHADEARKVIPHLHLRRFKVGPWLAHRPLADLGAEGAIQDPKWRMGDDGQWRAVANDRFGLDWISAVAAWFAHEVRLAEDIPIGLIESHFGGSKLHCWMPLDSLSQSPEFSRDVLERYRGQKAAWDQQYAAWQADPQHDSKQPPTEPWRPACLSNAMIHPLAPYGLKGVIWYQGESNVGRAEAYRRQLPALVNAWRQAFGNDGLWFLAVQLPAFGTVREWPRSAWAEMRESIAVSTEALPFAASVVSTDCGLPDEIHPPLKKPIGQRLARAARALVYGDTSLVWSGPTFRQAEFVADRCTVLFDHVGSGLVARDGPLVGFSLAGRDQMFHPATGEIIGDTVVLTSAAVPEPVAVRYAWQDSPVANLWNREGLPAGSFRSDIWELMTQARITTPLTLTEGGTPAQPVVFDGQGMLIDLGIDVTDHDWIRQGDRWTSQPGLLAKHGQQPRMAGQTAGLFIDDVPVTIPRNLAMEKDRPEKKSFCYLEPDDLQPGQLAYTADAAIVFRWPVGHKPGGSNRLFLPAAAGQNCVSIACSHITVRNLTVKHAGNDGFNIHGDRRGVRLERVRAIANADEGISAHETTELEVIGAEVAGNGSSSGGVADVNQSVTSYRDCYVHDNAAAGFFFAGRRHTVVDTVIANQTRPIAIQKGTEVIQERVKTGDAAE